MKNKKPLLHYFETVVLFFFVLLLPTQLGKHIFLPFSYISGVRIDYLSPTLFFTDVLAIVLIVLKIKYIAVFFKSKKLLFVVLFLLLNIVFSLSPLISLYRFIKLVEFLALIVIFTTEYPSHKALIIQAFLYGLIMQFALVFTQFSVKHSLQGFWYLLGERYIHLGLPGIAKASVNGFEILRPYGTFSHPNSMAGFYLVLSLFILTEKAVTNILFKYAFVFLSASIIILSFSKATLIIFGFLFLLYFGYTPSIRCRFCFIFKVIFVGILLLLFLQVQTDPLSFQKRIELASDALHIIMRYPFIGVGIGSYLIAQSVFPIRYPFFFLQPVHNIFLLLIAETGIPFALFLVGGMAKLFFNSIRKSPMLFPFLAFVLTGMIDHYWFTLQQNFLLLAVMSGIFYSNTVLLKKGFKV